MKNPRPLLILCFLFVCNLQIFSYAQNADVDHAKVDQIFAAYNKPDSPGCALGVIRDGEFAYRKAYGSGSLELGTPLSSRSVFYMGSVSKQFTAASVVLAQEQGYLSLDDDVHKYIPELPDYGRPITLRHLLHHTSGLRDFLTLLSLSGRSEADLHSSEEMLALIVRQKELNNIPGDEYIYSNTNYFLLGEVIRRTTKKSLEKFAAENIFNPLGMTHTRFYDDHSMVIPNRVAAYGPTGNGKFVVDWSTNFDTVGAGGLMSTVDDLLLWDRNFYSNKLGKGTLLKELQTQGALNNGKKISYALGLEIGTYRGLPIVEHGGALFGYRSEILRFPEQRFTVLCLCNVANAGPGNLSRAVADVYLRSELKSEGGEGKSQGGLPDASRFAGKYLDPRTHNIYSFTSSDGNLIGWGTRLRRDGPNAFQDLGGNPIHFEETNGTMQAVLELDGERFFAGGRVRDIHPNETELADFSGAYASAELDATYHLSVEKGSLWLRIGWNEPVQLSPIAKDEFDGGDIGTLVFHRDASHRVVEVAVYAGNARDVRLKKTN